MRIETEREEDGRWITEVPDLPGAIVCADNKEDATLEGEALALLVLADRMEDGEEIPEIRDVFARSV